MNIILGSASLRRKEILQRMGYTFDVRPANIDEKAIRADEPEALTLALANAKADALLPKLLDDTILITSDQVVFFKGSILEKPESVDHARQILQSYGHEPVNTVTAVVVVNKQNGKRVEGVDVATIYFKPFTEELLRRFAGSGKALEHAGAFAAEDPLFTPFIEKIDGTIESISGLPPELTRQLINDVQ